MSLRVKVECVLLGAVSLFIALGFALQRYAILPQIDPFEESVARRDLLRGVDTLRDHQFEFEAYVSGHAGDLSKFPPDSGYEAAVYFADGSRTDLSAFSESATDVVSGELFSTLLQRSMDSGTHSDVLVGAHGVIHFVAIAPLAPVHVPPARYAVVTRALGSAELNEVYNEAGIAFQIEPFPGVAAGELDESLRGLAEGRPFAVSDRTDEYFNALATYRNAAGEPVLLLRSDVHRGVYANAHHTLQQGLVVQLVVGAVMLVLLILVFRATITEPLTRLTRHTATIKPDGDLSARIDMKRTDEIGVLADEFDRMVEELESDMVQRRAAESALRESEERYALAMKGANDGLWDWDLTNNQVYYSPRWLSMLGYERGQVDPDPEAWFQQIHEDDVGNVRAAFEAHLNGYSEHFESEFRMRHRAGKYVWVLCRGIAIPDEAGTYTRMAGSLSDITLRKVFEEQLSFQALHDPLTTLPNRLLFFDRLTQALKRSQRTRDYNFAVLYLDLDRFKYVNDGLGHVAGDTMLTEVADRIEAACAFSGSESGTTTIARFGGDEFAVLLDDVRDVGEATQLAVRIIQLVGQPFQIEESEIYVTVSIGVAMSAPDYDSAGDLVRNADTAMYQAKSQGKGGFAVFDADMHEVAMARLQIENDLRRAIGREEFQVYYQPIVDLTTGTLHGVEALVRWRHPDRGMVSPFEFTGVAEETGMILPIGQFVLREACRQVRIWQERHPELSDMKVSVNLSVREFTQPGLVENVLSTLSETGFAPENLKLEITETVIMEGVDMLTRTLQALRDAGIHLCIDDFGTGYSSLSYLHRFPMDTLKIDQAFVREMHVARENRQIVQTILMLAQSLGMHVIAEGIEHVEQLDELRALGCEHGQGYYFSKPKAPEDLEEFIVRAQTSLFADAPAAEATIIV